MATLDDRTG